MATQLVGLRKFFTFATLSSAITPNRELGTSVVLRSQHYYRVFYMIGEFCVCM